MLIVILERTIMADMTFHEVLQAARKLSPQQKALLIEELQVEKSPATREMLIAELEHLRTTGAFENVESLANKYAVPGLEISFEELRALRTELSTEWEKELEEFDGNDD
jgi:hypothetical protein